MDKIIEQIWNEEFRPAEGHFIYNEEIRRKQLILDDYEDKLRKLLNKDGERLFDDFISAFFDVLDLSRLDAYIGGFHFSGKFFKELFIK